MEKQKSLYLVLRLLVRHAEALHQSSLVAAGVLALGKYAPVCDAAAALLRLLLAALWVLALGLDTRSSVLDAEPSSRSPLLAAVGVLAHALDICAPVRDAEASPVSLLLAAVGVLAIVRRAPVRDAEASLLSPLLAAVGVLAPGLELSASVRDAEASLALSLSLAAVSVLAFDKRASVRDAEAALLSLHVAALGVLARLLHSSLLLLSAPAHCYCLETTLFRSTWSTHGRNAFVFDF